MKKEIKLKINGEEFTVTVERTGNIIHLDRDGRQFDVELVPDEKPVVKKQSAPRPAPKPSAGAPKPAPAPAAASGPGTVEAPITGVVKEIVAAAGTAVTRGEPVLIMEAMKMDIEVSAPNDGTIQEVFVQPGQNVREKDPLLRIE